MIYIVISTVRSANRGNVYRFNAASSMGMAPGAAEVVVLGLSKRLGLRPIASLNDDERSCITG